MNNELSLLSKSIKAALATSLLLSTTAFSAENEQANTKEAKDEQIEVIEVSGYRGSVQKSLNTKRFSDGIVDAISAEDVGKFPDQTVADSLQRIPGVSIEKDFGEGDKVSIRGTSPHLNLTLINGQNLASATASAQVTKSSRGFNYSILPSEIVETLEVHKTAQADIDEGAIGGTVIVRTRKPLDAEANTGAFTVKGVHQDSSGETSPFLSGFYTWKNDNEDLGFNLSYTHKDNNVQRDSKEVRSYYREQPDDAGAIPAMMGYNRYTSNNILDTLTNTIQFAPTDNLDFVLNNIYSKVENSGQGTFTGSFFFNDSGVTDKEVVDGIVVGGTRESQGNDAIYSNAGYEGEFHTFGNDLKATYSGDNYEVVTQLGYTSAEGEVQDVYTEAYADTDISWDLSGDNHDVVFHDVESADDFNISYAHVNDITNAEDELYAQTDLNYILEHDFFSAIKVGLKYRDHNKSSDLMKSDYSPASPMSLDPFATGPTDDFYNGGTNDALYGFDQAAWNSYIASTDPKAVYERIDYFFDLNEKITAGYVKADFTQDRLRGNFGVRYVKTDLSSAYWDYTGSKLNPDTKELKDVKHDYTDILPSINLNYDVSDDVVTRMAVAKVMSRPDYDNLAGRRIYDCNPECTGTGGNPELDPYRANQFDLSVEWYFNSSSILSVAYYYKDIETYITQRTEEEQLLDDDGVERTYDITKPVNGNGGTNKGYEINYSQDIAYGFGIQANYTFSDVDLIESEEQIAAGREALLPGNSEDTYNLTAYFENDDYSARVSYNYRSEYLYSENVKYGNKMKGAYGQYDATFAYNLNEITTFTLQAINLTDAEQKWNYDGDEDMVYQDHQYGRRIMLGVSVKL